jgi:hypothetical protein
MPRLRFGITMSLDGYVAGPNQSVTHPLGEGGQELHKWAFAVRSFRQLHGLEGGTTGPDDEIAAESLQNIGATIMGRHMFGGGDGPWGRSDRILPSARLKRRCSVTLDHHAMKRLCTRNPTSHRAIGGRGGGS